jgi:hypothetical protein
MIDEIVYRGRLNKLQRNKRDIAQFYKKRIDDAKQKKDETEADYQAHCMSTDTDAIENEIRRLVTQRLFYLADKYLLPRPEFGDIEGGAWEETFPGRYTLKPEAMAQLRAVIREEQKASSEHMRLWLVPLTGLVGAITGLIAVISALL